METKKIVQTLNKPIIIIATLIASVAVVFAKIFMTKDENDKEE